MSAIKPTLPFKAEPMAKLQARYSAALDPVYDTFAVMEGVGKRPGELRKHVFDTEDGYRMIVSRESLRGRAPVLHISVSLDVDPRKLGMTIQTMQPMCLAKVQELAQFNRKPSHTEFTGKVLHFIFTEPTLPQEHVRQHRPPN